MDPQMERALKDFGFDRIKSYPHPQAYLWVHVYKNKGTKPYLSLHIQAPADCRITPLRLGDSKYIGLDGDFYYVNCGPFVSELLISRKLSDAEVASLLMKITAD